ncbi:MAG: histidine phosphatase family protein [Gammaproteobacteria bacterium]
MSDTVIDIMRHGEPIGGRRFRGNGVDDPLSDLGWQQMRVSVGDMKSWDYVITSPLKRCQSFADDIAQGLNIPVMSDPRLREVGFGVWEGKSSAELQAVDQLAFDAFYKDPVNCRPEGAESLQGFGGRVSAAIDDIVNRYPGEHILIIAHAGVIRAGLGYVLNIAPDIWYRTKVDNAGITRFRFSEGQGKLEFHNRLSLSG